MWVTASSCLSFRTDRYSLESNIFSVNVNGRRSMNLDLHDGTRNYGCNSVLIVQIIGHDNISVHLRRIKPSAANGKTVIGTVFVFDDFFYKHINFGNHLVVTYGNYVKELKLLGDALGLEVVTA